MNVIEPSASPAGTAGPAGAAVSTGRLSNSEVQTLAARFRQALHGGTAPVMFVDGRAIPVTPADQPAAPVDATTNQAQSHSFVAHFGSTRQLPEFPGHTGASAERFADAPLPGNSATPLRQPITALESAGPAHLPTTANPTAVAATTRETPGATPLFRAPNQLDITGPALTIADQPATPPSAMVTTNQINVPVPEEAAAEQTEESEGDTLGAAMLQSLLQQSSNAPAAVQSTAATTAPTSRVQSLESVVAETVSRVLVSDPLHDGRREVRIEFNRDVLPDTQVRLWRDGGRLHVEFTSPPAVAERGLQAALPRLGDAIQQRQAESAAPVVTLRAHGFDTGGQPGDGRSRQRYRTQEEVEGIA